MCSSRCGMLCSLWLHERPGAAAISSWAAKVQAPGLGSHKDFHGFPVIEVVRSCFCPLLDFDPCFWSATCRWRWWRWCWWRCRRKLSLFKLAFLGRQLPFRWQLPHPRDPPLPLRALGQLGASVAMVAFDIIWPIFCALYTETWSHMEPHGATWNH